MSSSPWLASTSNSDTPDAIDPWSEGGNGMRSRLGSRAASSSHLSVQASGSRQVDRHPLRSPSPNTVQPGTSTGLRSRRSASDSPPGESLPVSTSSRSTPGGIASEWRAISAGLAGLFGSATAGDRYEWPEDPVTGPAQAPRYRNESRSAHAEDQGRKGHPPSALDKLEGWFGLRDNSHPRDGRLASASHPSLRTASSQSAPAQEAQVRVLIHPVAPTDTLSSLALHYGADIQTLRRSNKLWPGDAVQMRSVMYIPIDSCKHRPPNAEIKVFASDGGAIVPSEQQGGTTAALKLAFVPKEDEEDYTEVAANGSLSAAANSLGPPAEDPASDFMPDTNKSYADEGIPGSVALGRSSTLSRTGSISRLGGGYPSSLAPSSRPDRRLGAVPASDTNSHSGAGLERTHSRTGSVGASTSASASAASSGFVAPKGPIHVSKVPAEKLKFFTPSEKRRAMTDDGERKPTFGVGPGHPDYQPGDSGLDDLLKQRSDEAPEDRPRKSAAAPTANARPSLLSHVSDLSSTATSDNHDVDSDADWKPNVWKFGESRSRSARGSESRPSVGADSGGVVFDAGIESDRHHAPSAAGDHLSASVHAVNGPSSYAGWNDAPPPDAIVAKAYDGGAGYRKRQHQKHHRLLHDLAAGLPANTGAASKWARPINFGDSLPPSVPVASGSIGRSGAISPLPPGGKGFGRLLNDTIRGRISVEGALGAALDEVRTKTALDLPHHEAARQARPPATPVAPPPKVSLVNDGATSQNQRPSSREHELNKFVAAGGHADGDTRAGGPSGGLAPSASPWRSGSGQQPRARHRSQADKDD